MRTVGIQFLHRLLLCFAVALFACAARADELTVLWWQVGDWTDETETGESLRNVAVSRFDGTTTTAYDLGATAARIREVSTGTYLKIMDIDELGQPIDFTLDYIDVPMRWVADISGFSSGSPEYSFVIELGNYDDSSWSLLALSETATYADLAANHHIETASDYNPNPVAAWMPTSYVVPEPTSCLLVLIGTALLALRRRRGSSRRG